MAAKGDKTQLIEEIKKDLAGLCDGLREMREFENEFRKRACNIEQKMIKLIWNIRGVFEMHDQGEFVKMLEEIKKGDQKPDGFALLYDAVGGPKPEGAK